MSDVESIIRSFITYEELLSAQFLCPVCGVILCAIVVFCIGVGFRSSSEPKFENAGEGDGVPFIKKKKKLKVAAPSSPSPKKANALPAAVKVSKKREDAAPDKSSQSLKFESKEVAHEPVAVATAEDWITPVTRKEKKARRGKHDVTPEKEIDVLMQPVVDPIGNNRKAATSAPIESSKRAETAKAAEPVKQEKKNARTTKASDASAKTTSPKEASPKTTSPKEASPKATAPKAASPKATSPKATSPKATAPKEASPKPVEAPVVDTKAKRAEKAKPEKVDDAKSKKQPKQKAKPAEVVEEPTPPSPPAPSTRSKKKKGSPVEAPAAASAGGGFPLADFELPSSVVVPAAAPQRKTPSPPSTDSSFELVDADAVREAFEAEQQEPSKTSGASRRKTKKPTTKSSLPAKVEEEVAPVVETPKQAPTSKAKAESEKAAASSNLNFDELGGSIEDWQDAKSSKKRRRARRDD